MVQNKALVLAKYPTGIPKSGQDLVVKALDIDLDASNCPEGGVIVKNNYVSFDPYQRGLMREADSPLYADPYKLGQVIRNRGISTVIVSKTKKFSEGDIIIVMSRTGTEEYTILNEGNTSQAVKLDNPYKLDPKIYLGTLGMPGMTAWSSLYEIGKPKKGETIFISAASGAVGQLVGQLAKHEGLKVIGSVGSDEKLEYILKHLNFDGGWNYKKEKPNDALNRLAPEGVDIYYENVGGEQLEAAIDHMNTHGRIGMLSCRFLLILGAGCTNTLLLVVCGMISQYNLQSHELYPIRNLITLIKKRILMQGFVVSDLAPKYYEEFYQKLPSWIADGSFKILQHVVRGIDNAADGFIGMLEGGNFGKAVLEIDPL